MKCFLSLFVLMEKKIYNIRILPGNLQISEHQEQQIFSSIIY